MDKNNIIPQANNRSGLTLVEISIVMVIFGLLIGGVLIGKQLIHASRLHSVLSDIEKFNAAAQTFRSKYDCIPGDCANATKFFGAYGNCASSDGVEFLDRLTCNGNGDGKIIANIASGINYWRYDESTLFWQHLYLAGLTEVKYTGEINYGPYLDPGENVAKSKITGGCYSVHYSAEDWWASPYTLPVTPMISNFFAFGGGMAYWGGGPSMVICAENLLSFNASDAYDLDSKVDDGAPFTGDVQAPIERYGPLWNDATTTGGCTNSSAGSTYPYNSNPAIYEALKQTTCQLYFKAAF